MAGRKPDSSAMEERSLEEGMDFDEQDGWAMLGESESGTDDLEGDPTFDVIEQTRSELSRMSLRKSRPRAFEEMGLPQLNDKDKKCFEAIEEIIKGGELDKLKVDECRIYLRKYGLRLTGNKNVLQARIKEHLEVMEGGGEKKYPISSFVLNCKGDACMGDVVMFEQNVYDMFSIASRSATGPPCGTRKVAGRIVKESYGAAKQQHTFTIEVLWSKGEKPLPPLHPLLIKGRNLYRLTTMRQRWDDEEERKRVLQEKHRRGCVARCSRETRIQEKEMKRMARGKRLQAVTSEKSIAAGAQNTKQQALVPEKSISTEGHRNAVHHQKPEKCSDRTQCKQNSSSAQALQPQASVTALPHLGANHENALPSRNLHFPSRLSLPPEEKRSHHRDGLAERRPLRTLNSSSSILGSPPHGHRIRSNHQDDGFFDDRPWRNLNSPPRVGSYLHRDHHPVQRQPCRWYLQGRCWYGDDCRYLH